MGPAEPPLRKSRRGRRVWAKAARGGGSARAGVLCPLLPPRARVRKGRTASELGSPGRGHKMSLLLSDGFRRALGNRLTAVMAEEGSKHSERTFRNV